MRLTGAAVRRPLALAALLLIVAATEAAETRSITDSAGRRVEIPRRVERVYAAGGPASIFLYTLAPERMLGWNRALTSDERAFVPARYADLPALGRLTGRGNTANVETVLAVKPDVIIDYGALTATYVSLADRTQQQTGVPYLLLDGGLSAIPAVYTRLGDLLGVPDRGRELARYAERLLAETDRRVARVPVGKRPAVYYARGPKGLETAARGSINVESIERLGARNVAERRSAAAGWPRCRPSRCWRGIRTTVIAIDPAFVAAVRSDPVWKSVRAVREGRVYLVPQVPFPWIDFPPSVNRLIGLRWLGRVLLSRAVPGGPAPGDARLLHALLPSRAVRAAARRPAGRPRAPAPLTPGGPGRPPRGGCGFLLAGALLVGLVIVAFSVGRFPVSPGQLVTLLWAKLTGAPHGLPPRRWRPWCFACAARACSRPSPSAPRWPPPAPPTRASSGTRWSRPTSSACPPARRWAPCSASSSRSSVVGDPGARLRRGPGRGRPASTRWAPSLRRHDPMLVLVLAGVVIGTLLGLLRLAAQVPGRSLQSAPRHHLLAARQPLVHHRRGPAARSCRGVLLGLVPL